MASEDVGCQRCLVDFCEDHMRKATVSPMAVLREHQAAEDAEVEAPPQEDRYEHIDLVLKTRPGSPSWFDIIHDYITQDCDSVEIECQSCGGTSQETIENYCDACEGSGTEWTPCQCGMETMGGMSGTLQQCYDHGTTLGQGLQPIDVARVIVFLHNPMGSLSPTYVKLEDRVKVVEWAKREIEFEAYFENRVSDED